MLTDYDKTQQALEIVVKYMTGLISQGISPERAIEHTALRFGADRKKLAAILHDARPELEFPPAEDF